MTVIVQLSAASTHFMPRLFLFYLETCWGTWTTFRVNCRPRETGGPRADEIRDYWGQRPEANSSDLSWHVVNSRLRNGSFSLDLGKNAIQLISVKNATRAHTRFRQLPCKVLGTRILLIISRKETTITCRRCSSWAIFEANSSLLNNWTLTWTTRLLSVSGSEDRINSRDILA